MQIDATVAGVLTAYRADRAPVVAVIDRIDSGIARMVPKLGLLRVNELTRGVLNSYTFARTAEGVKPQTVRREFGTLRAALRMAWRDGVIDRVPPIPMPPKGRPRERWLNEQEVTRLLAACAGDLRVEALVRLLISTAGRVAAVCELTWDRVDTTSLLIDLRAPHPRATRRKGRAVVPVDPGIVEWLKAFRDLIRPDSADTDRVLGLSPSGALRALQRVAARAGIEGVTPHVMRHTAATHLLKSEPLPHASKMLGHASVAITADIYGHLRPDDLRRSATILGRLAGVSRPAE